ncbi:MAG: helix-turn-helix domain-containing protein, partial [Bacteroidia bacterium]
HKDVLKLLAYNVKYIRNTQMKLSQEHFAVHCGLTLRAISALERCKGSDLYTITKIAHFVGKPVSALLS